MALTEPPPELKGILLISAAAGLWATTAIAAKVLFTASELSPLTLGFLRLLVAAPLFFILSRRAVTAPGKVSRMSWAWLLLLGLAQAGYQGFYLWAVDLAGAGLATLVALCLAPVLVALVAIPVLEERFNLLTLAGLAGAIAGTAMLAAGGGELESNPGRLAGIGIAGLAAAAYAAFTLLSRQFAGSASPYQIAFVCFSSGAAFLLPLVVWQSGLDELRTLTTFEISLILYIGLVPTCLGYVCFFHGMRYTAATTSSIIVTLEPLFAALLAWVLLGENLGYWGLMGALVLVLAVVLASRGTGRG